MAIVKVKCVKQEMVVTEAPTIASGSQQFIKIQFEFCPTWEGFTKTAVFYRNEDNPYNVVLQNDECLIPDEVLQHDGKFYFGVFGIKDSVRITTNVIIYPIAKGAIEGEIAEPTAEIYEQILTQYGDINTKYDEINDKYDEILTTVEDTARETANQELATVNSQISNLNTGLSTAMTDITKIKSELSTIWHLKRGTKTAQTISTDTSQQTGGRQNTAFQVGTLTNVLGLSFSITLAYTNTINLEFSFNSILPYQTNDTILVTLTGSTVYTNAVSTKEQFIASVNLELSITNNYLYIKLANDVVLNCLNVDSQSTYKTVKLENLTVYYNKQ